MKNKNNQLCIRLDDKQRDIIFSNSSKLHMTSSEYIRSLLSDVTSVEDNHSQEIASILCKLQIRLCELGLEDEEISREVYRLCQMLS